MEVCQGMGYGIPTWGPSHKAKGLLATGTYAGSAEQQNLMRIFKYDVNNPAGLVLQGVTQSPAKFSSLDWIDFYPPSQDDYGIIAGGMDDGAITLWDPKKILDGQSTMETLKLGKGCVSATKIHNGVPVGSIEFNPHKKNLLASGGSEVLIQDIGANMKQPNVFKPGVPNYHEGARITSISWNRIVPHILASASENGKIVVWDLKVNKSIFNFTEPSSSSAGVHDYFGEQDQTQNQTMRETQMMWNPEIPTQFVVANDDDKNPTINIWDLRNPDYPVATFSDIHYSGILSFSWCLSDPSLVVSSGKDKRTVVTNFKTGEQVLAFPTQSPYKKIKWSNHLHGKICAMDEEGTSSILSFEPEGLYSNPEKQFATPAVSQKTGVPFNPQWNQPKCGIRWGFGNKLVTFDHKSKGMVRVHQKGSNAELAQKVNDFDNQLESLSKAQICDIMSKNAKNDYDMMEFKVLKCLIEDNYDDLLKLFGIDKNKAIFEVERMLGRKLNRPQESQPQAPPKPIQNTMLQTSLPSMTAEGAADFFSQLGQKDQAKPPQPQAPARDERDQGIHNQAPEADIDGSIGSKGGRQQMVQETISRNINWDEGAEGTIKKNLLIGKLEYAAQVALKCGRTTEALLIAEAGGQDLYEQIKAEYFEQHKDPFVKEIIQAISKDDFSSIIDNVTAHQQIGPAFCNWKETLAYIIAYQDDAKLKEVAKTLGDQLLEKKKDINSAIVCYILSNELDIVTDLWKKRALYQIRKGMNKQEALFNLFQKTILLQAAFKNAPANKDIDLILADFAEFLNADGLGYFAMKYLAGSSGTSAHVQNISDRIYFSQPQLQNVFQRPQPGFNVEQVRPQANNSQPQRQQVNHSQGGQMRPNQGAQRGQPVARPGPPTNQPMPPARQMPPQGPPQHQQRPNMPNQQEPAMRPRPQPVVQQPNIPPPQQQYNQAQPNTGAPGGNDLHQLMPPRQGGNLDESLDANFGYGESTKLARQPKAPNDGPKDMQNQPNKVRKPQQPQPPVKSMPIGKKPGPMHPAPSGGPQPPQRPGPPIPAAMNQMRPALPNQQMQGPPSSVAPMGTGPPQAFNPAQIQQRPQQPPAPNTQRPDGPPQKAHPSQGLRPPPIQRPPPMQSAPQSQGMPMQQPMPQAPPNQPPPNFASPAMRAPPSGPPPGRAPPKFAAPPMPQNQPGGPPQSMPPPQMSQAPPQAPPPGGSGGPKPMSSTLPSQKAMNQPSAGPMVNVQELVNGLQNLFNTYVQIEANQKAKGETEAKYNIMMQKIQGQQLQEMTMQKLQVFVGQVQSGNAPGASSAFRDITQKCWADVKDFSNALKSLQKCVQR